MRGILLIAVIIFVLGMFFLVYGIQTFVYGIRFVRRGRSTIGTLERTTNKFMLERNYVNFTDENGKKIKAHLRHDISEDIRNGEAVNIVYDTRNPKNVMFEEYNRFRYMSGAFFQMGVGAMVNSLSITILLSLIR